MPCSPCSPSPSSSPFCHSGVKSGFVEHSKNCFTSFSQDGEPMAPKTRMLLTTMVVVILGCDDRVAQIAREAADRQAQQNTEMARLNKEVAAGSQELVEADARARKDIVGVHHDLQTERANLDTSRTELESERREIASRRRTESMLVSLAS